MAQRNGPHSRPFGARKLILDLSGPEWDWLAEQAVALGIPMARRVRDVLAIASPAAQDPETFAAQKHALFEARQALYGFVRMVLDESIARFKADPEAFIVKHHRANPATLASNPGWDEPEEPR